MMPTTQPWRRHEAGIDCVYVEVEWLCAWCGHDGRAGVRRRAGGERRVATLPFHVVKRLWGFAKVWYRGIAKNLARAFSLFALANLYLVRRQLLPPQARCVR